MSKIAVAAKNLAFVYRDTPVLEDVSFDVFEGEFLGVIGPNGGGKTTLLKIILGFLQPLRGSVEVFGVSPDEAQKFMSYVPQSMQYDRQFPISVLELVLAGRLSRLGWLGQYSKQDYEAAYLALERVGLVDFARRPFGSLSGGQAQRALIARALVSQPRLLLLDEPTASVDSKAEAEIYQLLSGLRGQMTIMMVTHDLNAVISHVDRILCVQRGAYSLQPEQVCEHFAVGLYHPPLIRRSKGDVLP
jgi:zinc transport system ATP-binding protein